MGAGAAEFVGAAEALLIHVILDGLALFSYARVLFVHNVFDGRGRAVRLAKPLGLHAVRAVLLMVLLHHGIVGVLDSDLVTDGLSHRVLVLARSRFGLGGDLVQTLEILVVDPLLLGNQVSGNPFRCHYKTINLRVTYGQRHRLGHGVLSGRRCGPQRVDRA